MEETYPGITIGSAATIMGDNIVQILRVVLKSKVIMLKQILTLEFIATLARAAERNWEAKMNVKELELEGYQALQEEAEAVREERQRAVGGDGQDWEEDAAYGG
jgi:hypothetical protein